MRPAKRPGAASMAARPGGTSALRHRLLQGQERIDRTLDLRLVDEDDVADESRTTGSVSRPALLTAMPSASVGPPQGLSAPWIAFHIDG